MDSNEQNELTSKTDRLIDGKQDDSSCCGGQRLGDAGIEQKGERTRGRRQQCDDHWGEVGIRRVNDNGRITTKIKLKIKT